MHPAVELRTLSEITKINFERAVSAALAWFRGEGRSKTVSVEKNGWRKTTGWSHLKNAAHNGKRERARRMRQIARGMHKECLL